MECLHKVTLDHIITAKSQEFITNQDGKLNIGQIVPLGKQLPFQYITNMDTATVPLLTKKTKQRNVLFLC